MVLQSFIPYLGVLIALAFAMVMLAQKLAAGMKSGGKKPIGYGFLSSLIVSGIAYLSHFITNNLFLVFWILAGVYLIFGIIHLALMHTKYFYSWGNNKSKVFWGEIFFGIAILLFSAAVFSSLKYFIKQDQDFLFFPMLMSSLFFLLPILTLHTFEAAISIPPQQYNTWQYPVNQIIELPDEDPREKLLVIGFELAKNTQDKPTYFRAKAPENFYLGELFYHFINDYNEVQSESRIVFTDEMGIPHHWRFMEKVKWYQFKKHLDPHISVRNNHIRENAVIICERVAV